ncbi:MAG: photosynthetic complex putative assembly protein PuhB [Pseudomonadota bacterium]
MPHDDDFRSEPIRGLPALLPKGERILWQGAPSWKALALRGAASRLLAGWFGLVLAWNLAGLIAGRASLAEATGQLLIQGTLVFIALGVLTLIAWATARQTVYTVTNRRVVLRFGLAMDMSVNLPFTQIGSLDMAKRGDGTADLVLGLTGPHSLGLWHIWPNSKPWCWTKPRPMLRALPDGVEAGRILAEALAADQARRADLPAPSVAPAPRPAANPAPMPTGAMPVHPAE